MSQAILDYLQINFSHRDREKRCFEDSHFICGRYSIVPEHLAKCIKEYNLKDSTETKKKKMWYGGKGWDNGKEEDREGWLRPEYDCA